MSEFASFCERLKLRLRATTESPPLDTGLRQAAVALVLRQHMGVAELLIIKRATAARDHWSGNLALPGGRQQADDTDLCATARRETHEEVGIDLASGGEVLGRLDTIRTTNPLAPQVAVTPFVAIAPSAYHISTADKEPQPLTLNHEVAVAFWVPIPFLKENGRSEIFRLIVDGTEREWPAYATTHGSIWGMTERILTRFLALAD